MLVRLRQRAARERAPSSVWIAVARLYEVLPPVIAMARRVDGNYSRSAAGGTRVIAAMKPNKAGKRCSSAISMARPAGRRPRR